jgi:hypothetical protein
LSHKTNFIPAPLNAQLKTRRLDHGQFCIIINHMSAHSLSKLTAKFNAQTTGTLEYYLAGLALELAIFKQATELPSHHAQLAARFAEQARQLDPQKIPARHKREVNALYCHQDPSIRSSAFYGRKDACAPNTLARAIAGLDLELNHAATRRIIGYGHTESSSASIKYRERVLQLGGAITPKRQAQIDILLNDTDPLIRMDANLAGFLNTHDSQRRIQYAAAIAPIMAPHLATLLGSREIDFSPNLAASLRDLVAKAKMTPAAPAA